MTDLKAVPPALSPTVRRTGIALVALGGLALVSCGGSSSAGDTETFCSEIGANQEALTSPSLATDDDVDELVDLYADVGDHAPLAIEEEWNALTNLYETVSTLEPDDRDGHEAVKEQSFATERAAVDVREWVHDNCDINLGPVATIVDHDPQLPTSTTPPDDG